MIYFLHEPVALPLQTIRQHTSSSGDLQGSLEAYFKDRLDFDALRTQLIITLADKPELCGDAVRLQLDRHPGDGADYGFWVSWDSIEDAQHDGELLRVSDISEVPDDHTGSVLLVNDHGNATLYDSDGNELWAVV